MPERASARYQASTLPDVGRRDWKIFHSVSGLLVPSSAGGTTDRPAARAAPAVSRRLVGMELIADPASGPTDRSGRAAGPRSPAPGGTSCSAGETATGRRD